uniref:Uncharacterized protein n=1 Tax=Cacopsylla melanoneura TaxID=428564 RepID=A0A8D8U7F1_9HEMI
MIRSLVSWKGIRSSIQKLFEASFFVKSPLKRPFKSSLATVIKSERQQHEYTRDIGQRQLSDVAIFLRAVTKGKGSFLLVQTTFRIRRFRMQHLKISNAF